MEQVTMEQAQSAGSYGASPYGMFGRRSLAGVLPCLLLAFLPKCPACLAGYVALWTGVGLSLSAASGLRHALIVVCAGMLLFVLGRQLRRILGGKPVGANKLLAFPSKCPEEGDSFVGVMHSNSHAGQHSPCACPRSRGPAVQSRQTPGEPKQPVAGVAAGPKEWNS